MMQQAASAPADPLLRVENLVVEYPVGDKTVHAVSGVSLEIARGETLGLVGESGCGKSTLGRAVMQLRRPVSGRVLFDGHDLTTMQGDALRADAPARAADLPGSDRLAEPAAADRRHRRRAADHRRRQGSRRSASNWSTTCSAAVGLDPELVIGRLPHEFSGGQCQRICIARALVLNPDFIICDEPVSALDVSIRAQILNLLEEMKARYGLTLLFIAHDLAVVKAVSDRVAVMYLGRLCEVGPSEQLFAQPAHPYTALLIEAIPVPDPDVRPAESRGGRRAAVADRAALRLPVSHPLPARGPALQRRSAGTSRSRAGPVRRLPSSIDRGINSTGSAVSLAFSRPGGRVHVRSKTPCCQKQKPSGEKR